MPRAAIYLRVSDPRQAATDRQSIPVQREACRAYAAREGYEVVAEEVDADSAWEDNSVERAGYQRVLALARQGGIDALIIPRFDRFGREEAEAIARFKELTRLGVRLLSPNESYDSPVMVGLLALLAADESRRISMRVRPARRRMHAAGRFGGNRPPFGTVSERGVLRPGPHFDLALRIFQWAAEGVGEREIDRRLAAVLPRSPGQYGVRYIVRNPAYIGRLRGTLPDGTHGEVPAAWEPLIPIDLWQRAQAAFDARRYTRPRSDMPRRYWSRGLVRCGICGHAATLTTKHSRRKGRVYASHIFRCNHRCRSVQMSASRLQAAALALMRPVIALGAAPGALDRAVAAVNTRRRDGADGMVALWRRERDTLVARRNRVEDGFLDGLYSAERARELKEDCDARIADLTTKLAAHAPAPPLDMGRFRDLFNAILDPADDPAFIRATVYALVQRINLYPHQRIELVWQDDITDVLAVVSGGV